MNEGGKEQIFYQKWKAEGSWELKCLKQRETERIKPLSVSSLFTFSVSVRDGWMCFSFKHTLTEMSEVMSLKTMRSLGWLSIICIFWSWMFFMVNSCSAWRSGSWKPPSVGKWDTIKHHLFTHTHLLLGLTWKSSQTGLESRQRGTKEARPPGGGTFV